MGLKGSKQIKCPKGCVPIPQQQSQFYGMPMLRPQCPVMQQQCPMPLPVKLIYSNFYVIILN